MIRWRRIEAGRYLSEDKRFEIRRVKTLPYPGTWLLIDNDSADKGEYYKSRLACQMKAEDIKADWRRTYNGKKAEQKDDTTQRK